MNVFVTGGSGWVGSAVIPDLLAAGHAVASLARSADAAQALERRGARSVPGSLDDLDVIAAEAAASDGVVHLAFRHDFADFAGSIELDAGVVRALAEALTGTDKPLVITGGTPATPGRIATEQDRAPADTLGAGREGVSDLALSYAARGVRASVVRLPRSVHGEGDAHGFVATLSKISHERGVAGYIGDGNARWPAVHVKDAASLYRLALERAPAGSVLHAVGDEGVPFREIAAALARANGVVAGPVEPEALGFLGMFAGIDQPASAVETGHLLGWTPQHPGLVSDIESGYYNA